MFITLENIIQFSFLLSKALKCSVLLLKAQYLHARKGVSSTIASWNVAVWPRAASIEVNYYKLFINILRSAKKYELTPKSK